MGTSFKNVDFKKIKTIIEYYQKNQILNQDVNKLAVFKKNGNTITIFQNNTVLFQGNNEFQEASKFFNISKQESSELKTDYYDDVIGNDEVGVGDIFGPVVFTSSYFTPKNLIVLKQLNIKDSKKISNQQIIPLAIQIMNNINYATIIIDNNKYNELYCLHHNSHIIKAIGHNEALKKFFIQYPKLKTNKIYIDEFASKINYLKYLQNETNIINTNLYFITKGETKFLSIACSAIISRFYFLQAIKKLEQTWNLSFPLGASNQVKKLAQEYYSQYQEKKCSAFMKLHFNREI